MSTFEVPAQEAQPYPSLGWLLVPWMEQNLVFGPGDLRGQPLRLDDERKALIWRFYEVYPKGHPNAGRRRFRRCGMSVRKGVGKTELAALIAGAELSPSSPVRCIGWGKNGRPLGGPVTDPYIPLVAYTEEQSEDLAYGALRAILELSPIAREFDIGIERIMRVGGDGKAVALASAPDARDGARTTFSVADETHRWTLPRLRMAHRVMLANLPKRRAADPWSLETTTSYAPGEGSVAEQTMAYARAVADGLADDARLYFFHRQAGDGHDLATKEGVRAAVVEASGPTAAWSDVEGIVEQFDDPSADRQYLRRVWLNQVVTSRAGAFDVQRWASLSRPEPLEDGAQVALAFSGGRYGDASAVLVAIDIGTGRVQLVDSWEAAGKEVPAQEVNDAVAGAFARWDVWRMYATPTSWDATVDAWAGEYDGDGDRVIPWRTNQHLRMSLACQSLADAIVSGSITHDGAPVLERHLGAARRYDTQMRDEAGRSRWVIRKEREDGPGHINGAVAVVMAWQAYRDALALGVVASADGEWDGEVMALS